MIRKNIDNDVLDKFLQSPMFSFKTESELPSLLLTKAVDFPRSRNSHTYYEGYFHSLRTSDPIYSRNPRSGKEFMKPPADDFIRSFYESFRRLNENSFKKLEQQLENLKSRYDNDLEILETHYNEQLDENKKKD